ncbi:PAS domain S-box protein [Desulfosporosinus hippei]|uniref:PAS domain S-box protein n=1 Tax=Desulfosporosinus hippei TaxID=569859 RepID=UPI000B83908D|nr:PAS domain S-box protein [Desulfosporosinus hippei]
MYYDLASNVLDVMLLCGILIWINLSLKSKYSRFLLGILFGLITIFVIKGRIEVFEDHFYDFRNITMTMAGFIGGPITAIIAAFIGGLYRYFVGGNGSMGGVFSIIVFACFGSILRNQVKSSQNGKKLLFWYIIGMVMSCISLFVVAFTPPWGDNRTVVLSVITVPVLIINPIATTILFNFYFLISEFFGKASILNTIVNVSPINLMVFDNNGPILQSKNLKMQHQTSQIAETFVQSPDCKRTFLNATKQEHREICTDDQRHYVADLCSFQLPCGEFACAAILNDVTDRVREQENLRGATNRFAKAFQLGPHMMAIVQMSDFRYIDVNDRFLEERNFNREDVIGKTPIELGLPESEFGRIMEILDLQGSIQNVECSLVTKFGSMGTVILSAEKIEIDDQECILFAYNDITEMKRLQTERLDQLSKYLTLEAELSRSNQLIADIINSMPDVFYVLDDQWRFTYINKKASELFRKTREELLGEVLWETIPQARGTLLELIYQKSIIDCLPITFEYPSFLHNDTWYEVTAYPSKFGLTVYYRDITKQKLVQEKLVSSQEEMTYILESMTDCFFAIDNNWLFTYVNRAGEKVMEKSREELIGMKLTEVFEANDTTLQRFNEVMCEKRSVTFEILSEALGNKWLEVSAYPIGTGLTCYFRDITSRKMAQDEMARLDRLNLVGQLAAGIGHEIRNPLTTIRGYLQLIGIKPDYAILKPTFDLMISEVDRANSIITEFLSLAQTKKSELKQQNLNDILDQLYPLLEADAFSQNKQIRFTLGEIFDLELNAKEITQLILNLTRNGLEAMAERGCLTIESYLQDDKVVLAIEDEGCGIPPENNQKLGTPFFTTKDTGTGLGLATCYKIVEAHGAKICVNSSSRGTTFYIYFPIPDQAKEKHQMIA